MNRLQSPASPTNSVGRKTKQALNEGACKEVDEVYAEFDEALKSLEGNGRSGVIYARYSSAYQHSIGAQVSSLIW